MHSFHFDVASRTMHIVTRDLWTPTMLARFTAEALARGTAARLRHGPFAVLGDAREAPVQHGYVVDGLAAMLPKVLKITTEPIAVVVGSHLGKMQTERYHKGPNCRTFLDIDEAVAWIAATRSVSTKGDAKAA